MSAYSLTTFAFDTGNRGLFSGQIHRVALDYSTKRIHFPPSVAALERRPSVRNYQNRQYLVGGHTANILIDEEMRALRVGITPPAKPDVSIGAGSTPYIIYLRFFDELTGEKSSLSRGKSLTGNATRTYINLPTSVPGETLTVDASVSISSGTVSGSAAANFGNLRPGDRVALASDLTRWAQVRTITSQTVMTIDDTGMSGSGPMVVKPVSRVSHLETWVAPNGGLPRFSSRVPIGTTGFTETVADLALGEALTATYEPMPLGQISCIYNDRLLVAGIPASLDTVYLSAIGFPERHEGLRFVTQFGEPIIGLLPYRDFVILICPESRYRLQGYTEDDYTRDVLEPTVGGIGHLGNRVTPSGIAIIPTREQISLYAGAVAPGMPTRRQEWIEDYRNNAIAFEGGFGAINAIDECYLFFPDANRLAIQDSPPPPVLDICGDVAIGSLTSISTPKLFLESSDGKDIGLYWFHPAQSPPLQLQPYETTGVHRDSVVGSFGDGYLYIGGSDATNIYLKRMAVGGTPTLVASVAHGAPSTHYVTSIEKYGNDIYLGGYHSDSGAIVETYRWDGSSSSLILDDDLGGESGSISWLRVLGSDLYMINSSTEWRRKTGGSWSSITNPFATGVQGMTVFGGKIYYTQSGDIRSIVGTTITLEHHVNSEMYSLAVFNDELYYLYDYLGFGDIRIGKFDGTTWTDSWKQLTPQFPSLNADGGPHFFGEFQGSLYLTLWNAIGAEADCDFIVISSSGSTTDGDWIMWPTQHRYADGAVEPRSANHGAVF